MIQQHAQQLLERGFKLCLLHPNTKQPVGDHWNKQFVTGVLDDRFYGFPLAPNKRVSVDPDEVDLARQGLAALGFNLEDLLTAGVRTTSTRPGSGGRSMFADPGDVRWIKFVVKFPDWDNGGELRPVTVLELRARSENLQDCVPGLVYYGRHGEGPYTQQYANGKTFLDAVPVPKDFHAWWHRLSTEPDYLVVQQQRFAEACGGVAQVTYCDLGRGAPLPFPSGCRMDFNREHSVDEVLAEHGYEPHGQGRYSPPSGTGAPGVRRIPGKDDLWQSDHVSDPLHGTFDAWVAYVILTHDGDLGKAEMVYRSTVFSDEGAPGTQDSAEAADGVLGAGALFRGPEIVAPTMLVDTILTGGLFIMASPPKTGKSRLLTQLMVAIDTGTPLMGTFATVKQVVLYYAVEDTPADIQKRLRSIGIEPTGASVIKLTMPQSPAELEADMLKYGATVAIIDTMAHFGKPPNTKGLHAYDQDTELYKPLKRLCDRYGWTIICVTHTTKPSRNSGDDPFMEIMGSTGKQGMANGMIIMRRVKVRSGQPKRVSLHVRGRSMPESEFVLEEDSGVKWRLVQDDEANGSSPIAVAVLDFLRVHGPSRAHSIIDGTGEARSSVYYQLSILVDVLKWVSVDRGVYSLTNVERVVGQVGQVGQDG